MPIEREIRVKNLTQSFPLGTKCTVKESEVTGSYHSVITQADYPPPDFFLFVINSVPLQAVSNQYYKLSANWQDASIRTTYGFLHSADSFYILFHSRSCSYHGQIVS